ncbi:MAG: FtsB family cell division protein [Candidatus Methylomirabilia bacterium]
MSKGNQQQAHRQGLPWRRHRGLLVLCLMGAFAFVLLVLSVFGDQGIFRIRMLARDRVILEQKVQDIESDNATLRRQLRDMKEGRASYELAAREKLGLVKPGEVVYDFRTNPLDPREPGSAGRP